MIKASIYWWYQRLSAVFLIPLTIWFLYVLSNTLTVIKDSNTTILEIFQNLSVQHQLTLSILAVILVIHMTIGMREVIEDYIHNEKTKLISLILLEILAIRIITDAIIYLYI